MKNIRLFLLIPFIAFISQAKASHIIGGEITYECVGVNQYLVTLILYRDCTSFTPFDNPANMTVYTQSGDYVTNFTLNAPVITDVPAESDNPCLDAPDDVCVEQAIYTKTITLSESDEGYILVYQRCCRNAGIVNIETPDDVGATYTQEIPPNGDVECNNSPVFNDLPPTVICVDDAIVFDHSATDPDGDSLAYFFFWPYVGASPFDPAPVIASAPPYGGVSWVFGFDEFYPVDALPPFAINETTGLLTGTALAEGRYVVGVVCKEYRDGVWLGDHIRDFQFNVVNCTPAITAQMDIDDIIFDDTTPDEIYLNCSDFTVVFDNFSVGGEAYEWQFGDGSTSTLEDPTHVYADTGTYFVLLIVNPGFICADTAIAEIQLYNTLTAAYEFTAGCSGTPVVFTDLSNSTEAGEIISWDWNFDDGSTSTIQNPEYEYADGGTYNVVLTVITDKGCQSSITYDVLVEPGPDVSFIAEDVCQNIEAEFINTTTITTGSISSYAWDFGDGTTSTEDEPFHLYNAPGTYTVTLIAYSANGCSDTLIQEIYIGELPFADAGPDQTVEYLETFSLDGSGVGSFTWTPVLIGLYASFSDYNIANPTVELEETTTFTLTVTSPDGCTESDQVTIFVEDYPIVEVPTAFSPNNDGTNDIINLYFHDISKLEAYTIYNRWGEIVFSTNDLTSGWNGKIDNKEDAEMGTYVYFIRAFDMTGGLVERQGNIILVR